MIIFIGCGKKKNFQPCIASEMYQGNFFSTCLSYAKTFKDGKIHILSAKYGILDLTDKITPYDKTLNSMSKQEKIEWTEMVKHQIEERQIDTNQQVIFLCGKHYYENLTDIFKNYSCPLEKYSGMGYQIQFMKSQLKKKLF